MKFEIWNEEKKEEEEVTKLRLINQENKIRLVTTNEEGNTDWNILDITSDGYLYLQENIPSDIGIKLDKNNKIKITKKEEL